MNDAAIVSVGLAILSAASGILGLGVFFAASANRTVKSMRALDRICQRAETTKAHCDRKHQRLIATRSIKIATRSIKKERRP